MGERPNIYWPKSVSTKREVGRERKEGGQRKGRSTQGDGDHEVHGIIIEGGIAELFKKESALNGN